MDVMNVFDMVLGIYKRWTYGNDIWTVDKSLAMKMTLKLQYNGTTIIDWQPAANQWWITGFNPNYQNKNVSTLRATFTVTFTNSVLYNAFYSAWKNKIGNGVDYHGQWNFNGTTTPIYVL